MRGDCSPWAGDRNRQCDRRADLLRPHRRTGARGEGGKHGGQGGRRAGSRSSQIDHVIGMLIYAQMIALPASQIILLVITAMLSAVPVALPATFTLGAALGARTLASRGVLLTRLSALHEAASIDVLCADKTGTLTNNELGVANVHPLAEGWTEGDVLAFAALASAPDSHDPVDAAIHRAAQSASSRKPVPTLCAFKPFDPSSKRAEASVRDGNGQMITVIKGAPNAVATACALTNEADKVITDLSGAGYRVLTVAVGEHGRMQLVGLIALNDPPGLAPLDC